MTNNGHDKLPDLRGAVPLGDNVPEHVDLGVQIAAFPRRLNTEGKFRAKTVKNMVMTPQGPAMQVGGNPARNDYLDAEELVEMIRQVVREELRNASKKLKDALD